nr:alpha/beta fold hydrolase [uncultured Lichenicoccus sp.]
MGLEPALRAIRFDECFGWLHVPSGDRSGGTAVILCSGLSTDGLTGYRPFRLLADALAGEGYLTLRFDYPGTGNSDDCETDDFWLLCRTSIYAAIDWLRHHGVADRVVLCGLRAGATLAMEAAATRSDIAGVLLIEPVLRGRSYLRQLGMEAGVKLTDPSGAAPLAVHELKLSGKAVRRMQQIDLRQIKPAAGSAICVLAQSPARLLSECVAAWRQAGVVVRCHEITGLEAMLRPVLMSHTASVDPVSILAWLRETAPTQARSVAIDRLPDESPLVAAAFTEMSVRFGARRELRGILCEPRQGSATGLVVVITNSSGNPGYGFARFGVELARDLATAGVASLRMDFTGLGDSAAPDDGPTHIFEVDRRQELRSAIDLLAARGYGRFAAHGLCSGAYHALQAAFDDPRITTLLLVNLQHLSWAEGDRVELKGYALRHPTHFLKRLGSGSVWVNLLRGRFDVAGIFKVQVARCLEAINRQASRLTRRLGRRPPAQATITDRMRELSLRARTLLLMSEGDEGIPVLAREFGSALKLPGTVVQIVPDLDHALSNAAMRRVVIDRMIAFLGPRTPHQPLLKSRMEVSTV